MTLIEALNLGFAKVVFSDEPLRGGALNHSKSIPKTHLFVCMLFCILAKSKS